MRCPFGLLANVRQREAINTVNNISRNPFLTLLKNSYLIAELPVISLLSINGSYIEGSSVNISCTATGKPDPEVSWVRNGQIKSSGMKIAYLNFDKIKRTDDGLYTCSANNSAGTKTHEEILVVRCESEIFKFLHIKLKFHIVGYTGAQNVLPTGIFV